MHVTGAFRIKTGATTRRPASTGPTASLTLVMAHICTLIVTAAPLARRAAAVATGLAEAGWTVVTVPTPNAASWSDVESESTVILPHERPPGAHASQVSAREADLLLVCPATFNTINKAALGIADTPAHSLLCELLGNPATTTVMVPMVTPGLWDHPAVAENARRLADMGVRFVDPTSGEDAMRLMAAGSGDRVAAAFDPGWVLRVL